MQPLQQADRLSAETLDGKPTQDESSPGRALGHALALRAEECCDLCYARASAYAWAGRPPDPTYTERSRGVNWLATVMTARWLAYGVPVSADEMLYIAERGELAASLQQSIVNITRAYLIWRDTIGEILRDEATRLNTPREVISDALRAVRMSCDASLVQMARAFDTRMDELSRELAGERETLLHQAFHDPLTGLPNRVLLYDRINQAVLTARRNAGTFAILAIDLDGFKAVNDSLGHDGGDIVLQHVADRLVQSVREVRHRGAPRRRRIYRAPCRNGVGERRRHRAEAGGAALSGAVFRRRMHIGRRNHRSRNVPVRRQRRAHPAERSGPCDVSSKARAREQPRALRSAGVDAAAEWMSCSPSDP